uniref:Uncharacterized protein n=1 Tax=Rhizophora mucronata TaxID=61149 RepID=A0A2P2QX52_RHIMU
MLHGQPNLRTYSSSSRGRVLLCY